MTALTADKSAASAGALLAAARQASGLSIEAVAQPLKLSPRQVRALEDGDDSAKRRRIPAARGEFNGARL